MSSTSKTNSEIGLCVTGNVDAGKSTLCGRLLLSSAAISPRQLEKAQQAAENLGKKSFALAFLSMKGKTEQERGLTIACATSQFSTDRFQVTLIDAPGHRSFIKNMINGAVAADASVLLVSAKKGEFEAGFGADGSTKEHSLLAFTMGINQVIVAVNKIDTVPMDERQERFESIAKEVLRMLVRIGFSKERIAFVPISAFSNININKDELDKAQSMLPWYYKAPYAGVSLFGAIDALCLPKRQPDAPLRVSVSGVHKIGGIGTVLTGRVETGTLVPNQKVILQPGNMVTIIRSIEAHHKAVDCATPGMNIGFNVKNLRVKDVRPGMILSDPENMCSAAKSFAARVVIVNHPGTIRVGYSPVIDIHSAHIACKLERIVGVIDKKSGSRVPATVLKKGDSAIVRFKPTRPMCVTTFADCPRLGRFAIRDGGRVVAIGVVKKVFEDAGE
mmetsp:Transcript_8484/g.12936  ORF Transcript_8484/g.12936 Transcript_8484/m.12936 type:complete len:446 (+) Transcript_8484:45-1382(+)|eukprot:CAMPEP_0201551988 /NCGR_PEP_ID=MMETSP0173_2-20130828/12180_1 /ASSEMBLY_ACC=CAM_ASM_000268 /TAXON_ID=218659 /ORGANISM="Vexillifera sp., Strain DIVA3 564/2" /LENGTH=445 /DNA_ID=CAMNT_0047962367 /DNA_START=45 /DNA_END=1382 /DNA_ORIENTATION=-